MRRVMLFALLVLALPTSPLLNVVLSLHASNAEAVETGWLLLQPPLDESQIEFLPQDTEGDFKALEAVLLALSSNGLDEKAPLAEWDQIAAFDSAGECEGLKLHQFKSKEKEREASERKLKNYGRKSLPRKDLFTYLLYQKHYYARCVPASAIQAAPGSARAWVLCLETRITSYNKPLLSDNPPEWTLQSAHATLRECDARAREIVVADRNSFGNRLVFGVEGSIKVSRKGFYWMSFEPELPKPEDLKAHEAWKAMDRATNGFFVCQCLPDSINPAVESQRERGSAKKQK